MGEEGSKDIDALGAYFFSSSVEICWGSARCKEECRGSAVVCKIQQQTGIKQMKTNGFFFNQMCLCF